MKMTHKHQPAKQPQKVELDEALTQFAQFLESKEMRLTRQRQIVLERLYQLDKHVSADELAMLLRQEKTGVSKATVYRTLGLLEESGLVEANDFRRGHRLYEFANSTNKHDHILCVDGEQVIEFQSKELDELIAKISRSYGYEPVSHTLVVYALCNSCKVARQEGEHPECEPSTTLEQPKETPHHHHGVDELTDVPAHKRPRVAEPSVNGRRYDT